MDRVNSGGDFDVAANKWVLARSCAAPHLGHPNYCAHHTGQSVKRGTGSQTVRLTFKMMKVSEIIHHLTAVSNMYNNNQPENANKRKSM